MVSSLYFWHVRVWWTRQGSPRQLTIEESPRLIHLLVKMSSYQYNITSLNIYWWYIKMYRWICTTVNLMVPSITQRVFRYGECVKLETIYCTHTNTTPCKGLNLIKSKCGFNSSFINNVIHECNEHVFHLLRHHDEMFYRLTSKRANLTNTSIIYIYISLKCTIVFRCVCTAYNIASACVCVWCICAIIIIAHRWQHHTVIVMVAQ